MSIIPYKTEEEAIEIANDSPYRLTAYIASADHDRAQYVSLHKLMLGEFASTVSVMILWCRSVVSNNRGLKENGITSKVYSINY